MESTTLKRARHLESKGLGLARRDGEPHWRKLAERSSTKPFALPGQEPESGALREQLKEQLEAKPDLYAALVHDNVYDYMVTRILALDFVGIDLQSDQEARTLLLIVLDNLAHVSSESYEKLLQACPTLIEDAILERYTTRTMKTVEEGESMLRYMALNGSLEHLTRMAKRLGQVYRTPWIWDTRVESAVTNLKLPSFEITARSGCAFIDDVHRNTDISMTFGGSFACQLLNPEHDLSRAETVFMRLATPSDLEKHLEANRSTYRWIKYPMQHKNCKFTFIVYMPAKGKCVLVIAEECGTLSSQACHTVAEKNCSGVLRAANYDRKRFRLDIDFWTLGLIANKKFEPRIMGNRALKSYDKDFGVMLGRLERRMAEDNFIETLETDVMHGALFRGGMPSLVGWNPK